AQQMFPADLNLLTVPLNLPARGERPPMNIRVGGNVQQAKLVRQPPPHYPDEARNHGIQGTVRLTALLGLDGAVVALNVESGPRELIGAALESVRQWQYKPTLLNGKPCYVITAIDVNF